MVERPSFFVSYSTIAITKKINTEKKYRPNTYLYLQFSIQSESRILI